MTTITQDSDTKWGGQDGNFILVRVFILGRAPGAVGIRRTRCGHHYLAGSLCYSSRRHVSTTPGPTPGGGVRRAAAGRPAFRRTQASDTNGTVTPVPHRRCGCVSSFPGAWTPRTCSPLDESSSLGPCWRDRASRRRCTKVSGRDARVRGTSAGTIPGALCRCGPIHGNTGIRFECVRVAGRDRSPRANGQPGRGWCVRGSRHARLNREG